MIANLTSENRTKEEARARHQEESARLLNSQIADLRRELGVKGGELERLQISKAKWEKEIGDNRETVLKYQTENVKLKAEVGSFG